MKVKSIVLFGIAGLVLFALCAGAALLPVGVFGWTSLRLAKESKALKISMLAPLPTRGSPRPASQALKSQGQQSSATKPGASLKPLNKAPVVVSEAAVVAPPPTGELPAQQVLSLALPPGTVNSTTQAGVATRLVIPTLNLDAPIVLAPIKNQTWQVDQLGQAVGHLEGTAPPGSDSNFVLAGHVTLAETNGGPGPFYRLKDLAPGDALMVYKDEEKFEYIVDSFQTVDRTAIQVTHPTGTAQITLITCTNWNKSEGRYTDRLVVKGHLLKN